ncbi:MAG: DUF6745 domain-containing protein [Promethearchaeota archaeon]
MRYWDPRKGKKVSEKKKKPQKCSGKKRCRKKDKKINLSKSDFKINEYLIKSTLMRIPDPPERFLRAADRELRKILNESKGEDFLRTISARIIHRDGASMLFEVMVAIEGEIVGVIKYVRVRDATRRKYHYLRVPPYVNTCREAIAWTFGLTPEKYKPIKEA